MAARDLARHVDASLCIPPASNAAWSVAPNRQSLGLSSDHTSVTDVSHTIKNANNKFLN